MLVKDYIALQLQKYKAEHQISLEVMAARLGIPKSSLYEYIKGRGNLRADTIDLLVTRLGITLPEVFADPSPEYAHVEGIVQAAKEFGTLTAEQRAEGVRLFCALVSLFSA